jgi:hypothetical protein
LEEGMSNFTKVIEFILQHEGGYVNHKDDPGGETTMGISKRAYPNLDIKNLKKQQVVEIYFKDYWLKAGCEQMDFPLAACQMDTAVNAGIGRANTFLKACNGDYKLYLELRRTWYLDLIKRKPSMKVFQKGWLNRVNDLAKFIDIVKQNPDEDSQKH